MTPSVANCPTAAREANPLSTSHSAGRRPVRVSTAVTIASAWPELVPAFVTVTPAMVPPTVVVTNCTLKAGQVPPSGISIRRASGSVSLTRSEPGSTTFARFCGVAARFAFAAVSVASSAWACVSRSTRSATARRRAAADVDPGTGRPWG